VTRSLQRPEISVVDRYHGKELEVVGRTVRLTLDQSATIAKRLKPAGVRHPWPDQVSTHWGRGSKTPLVKVRPKVVVEVAADAALQAGHYRPSRSGGPYARATTPRPRSRDGRSNYRSAASKL
jgi:hypothetical protein